MSVALQAKLLYFLATTLILLFGLQLAAAVFSEFAPSYLAGRFLYPVFLGRDPISIPNVLLNFSMLLVALGAFYYADAMQGESFFQEHVARRRRVRDGSVHFSQ